MSWLDKWKTRPGISKTWILGSGYSRDREIQMERENLSELCLKIVNDPEFKPKEIEGRLVTYCNLAILKALKEYDCNEFIGLLANQIIEKLKSKKVANFRQDNGIRAAKHAQNGGLALAGMEAKPHGHVAIIYPSDMEFSASLKRLVPICANVGRKNGIMKISEAFPVAEGEPDYWLYGETA